LAGQDAKPAQPPAFFNGQLQRRQRLSNPGVVGYHAFFQRHVEIHPQKHTLPRKSRSLIVSLFIFFPGNANLPDWRLLRSAKKRWLIH